MKLEELLIKKDPEVQKIYRTIYGYDKFYVELENNEIVFTIISDGEIRTLCFSPFAAVEISKDIDRLTRLNAEIEKEKRCDTAE